MTSHKVRGKCSKKDEKPLLNSLDCKQMSSEFSDLHSGKVNCEAVEILIIYFLIFVFQWFFDGIEILQVEKSTVMEID